MSDPAGLLLSVRGDARLTVPPDYVILSGAIELSRDSKAAPSGPRPRPLMASPPTWPRWARWRSAPKPSAAG